MDIEPSDVDSAVETNVDRLTLLRESRDTLRAALRDPMTPRSSLAPIAKQLDEVARAIDAIPGSGEVVPLDEIAGGIADDLAEQRRKRQQRAAG